MKAIKRTFQVIATLALAVLTVIAALDWGFSGSMPSALASATFMGVIARIWL